MKTNLINIQTKLKQQEVFLKLNGTTYVGSLLKDSEVANFPKQWEFDDDMRAITANKTRKDEHFRIVFGRIHQEKKEFSDALKLFRDVILELKNQNPKTLENKRDLLICCLNILGIITRNEFKSENNPDEVKDFIGIMNKILPPGQRSNFSEEILSRHAEARIRGNRLQLYSSRGLDVEIQKTVLIDDGIYAMKQIQTHLSEGTSPYLEKDPIEDLLTIKKYIEKISDSIPEEVTDILSELANENPYYSEELI